MMGQHLRSRHTVHGHFGRVLPLVAVVTLTACTHTGSELQRGNDRHPTAEAADPVATSDDSSLHARERFDEAWSTVRDILEESHRIPDGVAGDRAALLRAIDRFETAVEMQEWSDALEIWLGTPDLSSWTFLTINWSMRGEQHRREAARLWVRELERAMYLLTDDPNEIKAGSSWYGTLDRDPRLR